MLSLVVKDAHLSFDRRTSEETSVLKLSGSSPARTRTRLEGAGRKGINEKGTRVPPWSIYTYLITRADVISHIPYLRLRSSHEPSILIGAYHEYIGVSCGVVNMSMWPESARE